MIRRLFLPIFLGVAGCGFLQNPAYDRMSALAEEIRNNPGDPVPLESLIANTRSWRKWNRYYAYSFLSLLARDHDAAFQRKLIPTFAAGLRDGDLSTRVDICSYLRDADPAVLSQLAPYLLKFVSEPKEDSLTWDATEALGYLRDAKSIEAAVAILVQNAKLAPPANSKIGGPQTREFSLRALARISKNNHIDLAPQFATILYEADQIYRKRAAEIILEVDPSNGTALKVRQP